MSRYLKSLVSANFSKQLVNGFLMKMFSLQFQFYRKQDFKTDKIKD